MKKLAVSLSSICFVLILALAGIGLHVQRTKACTQSSLGILFDLKSRDQDEAWSDGVSATWTALNMKPGDEYPFESSFVQLRQYGLVCADHLEICMDYSLVGSKENPPGVSADDMARMMVITKMEYYSSSWRIDLLTGAATGNPPAPSGYRAGDWSVRDVDGDGHITFYDFKADPLDDLPPPRFWEPDSRAPYMRMSVKFSERAGNAFMGLGLNASVAYTLNQCSGQ